MKKYIQYKSGCFKHRNKNFGNKLDVRVSDLQKRAVKWEDGRVVEERYVSKKESFPDGYVKVCDLIFNIDDEEYMYSITGEGVDKVLKPYIMDFRYDSESICSVTTRITVTDAANYKKVNLKCVGDKDGNLYPRARRG